MAAFDGYLTNWDGFRRGNEKASDATFFQKLAEVSSLKLDSEGSKNWKAFRFSSKRPLIEGERELAEKTYDYRVLFRVNRETGNVIVAAHTKSIAEQVLKAVNGRVAPRLRPIKIRVRELAQYVLFSDDQSYALTAIYAHTPAYGENMKTAIFYGDDIAQVPFIREQFELFDPFIVGMRSRNSLREAARLGSDGYLRFYERGRGNFSELENCLAYVNQLGLYVR